MDLVNTVSSKKSLSAVIATTKTFTHIETFKDTLTDASKYNIELILVHDNQDLESRILIREIISELPDLKIVLIEGVYGNPGTARNEGLKKATSDWVCFWDSDDTPHISEIMNAIASVDSETECIVGRFIKVDKSNGKRLVSSLPTLKNITFEPGLWRMVFKQRSLKNIEFPPLRMAEDQLFLAATKLPILKVEYVNSIFYTYHVGQSFQLTADNDNSKDLVNSLRQLLTLMNNFHSKDLYFLSNLFAKQILTSLKRNNPRTKLVTCGILIKALISQSPVKSYSILKSLGLVLRGANSK